MRLSGGCGDECRCVWGGCLDGAGRMSGGYGRLTVGWGSCLKGVVRLSGGRW